MPAHRLVLHLINLLMSCSQSHRLVLHLINLLMSCSQSGRKIPISFSLACRKNTCQLQVLIWHFQHVQEVFFFIIQFTLVQEALCVETLPVSISHSACVQSMQQSQGSICIDMNTEKDALSLTCTVQPTLQNGPIKIAVYISGTTAILVSMNM